MQPDVKTFVRENHRLLEFLFSNIPDLFFLMSVDEEGKFRFELMNQAALQATGLTQSVYGKSFEDVLTAERLDRLSSHYRNAAHTKRVVTYIEDFGGAYGETVLTPIVNDAGICTHVFAITRDITVHEMHQRQLKHLAFHDPLTGLPNRRNLLDSSKTLELGALERKRHLAVMYMDCDAFKTVNDTFGHDVGDEFLVALSKRLRRCLREADMICRLGGDEFVAVATLEDKHKAALLGDRVLSSLNRPWTIGGEKFQATMSLGIAFYPSDAETLEAVVKLADQALGVAKNTGGNRFVIHDRIVDGT